MSTHSNVNINAQTLMTTGTGVNMSDCHIEGIDTDTSHEVNKIDLKHLISIISITRVLVDKGIVSRNDLKEAEKEAHQFVLDILNNKYKREEDLIIMQERNALPETYYNMNNLLVNISGSPQIMNYEYAPILFDGDL
jgi:hypothetical protein